MKQALKVVEEIERLKGAIEKTKSARLKNDYSKGIRNLTAELKEYCSYKNINFNDLMEGLHNVKRGQVWRLGEHYVMCGDATKKDDVNKLLRGGARDRFVFDRSAL